MNASAIAFRIDPFPSNDELNGLWRSAWNAGEDRDFAAVLARSLTHVAAFHDGSLVGFVNVAWDGGIHAFLLDTCVEPAMRRQGIATRMVETAIEAARTRGAECLHVDFEPHLTSFYRACGFEPTEAGLIRLR